MRRVIRLSHRGRDDRRHLGSGPERGLRHANFDLRRRGIIADYRAAIMVIIVSTVILRTAYYIIDKVFNIPSKRRGPGARKSLSAIRARPSRPC